MPNYSLQSFTEEGSKLKTQDTKVEVQYTKIMLKLAELLMQDYFITPEEKFRLTELIRKDAAV